MTDILVAGALHWDTVVDAPRLPRLDETLMGSDVAYRFGGMGGNQAVAAARMGGRVTMAGAVGTDEAGQQMLRALDDAGVNLRGLQQIDGPSGMSVAITDANGDYGAVVVSGVNKQLMSGQIAVPGGLKVLLLQNELPMAVTQSLIPRATGAQVILNAAPAGAIPDQVMRQTDVLIVNRIEAADLIGKQASADDMARALLDRGPKAVIITRGPEGCILAQPGAGTTTFPAHRVTVVSSHGAGDAFCGAFAAARAKGAALDMAIRQGQAYAALVVATTPGERRAILPSHVAQLVG
jgi:ribokinase